MQTQDLESVNASKSCSNLILLDGSEQRLPIWAATKAKTPGRN
jgi:hypothetical protein